MKANFSQDSLALQHKLRVEIKSEQPPSHSRYIIAISLAFHVILAIFTITYKISPKLVKEFASIIVIFEEYTPVVNAQLSANEQAHPKKQEVANKTPEKPKPASKAVSADPNIASTKTPIPQAKEKKSLSPMDSKGDQENIRERENDSNAGLIADYENKLSGWLDQNFKLENIILAEPTEMMVLLRIAPNGKIIAYRLHQESDYPQLNAAIISFLQAAKEAPTMPAELVEEYYDFLIPLKFS